MKVRYELLYKSGIQENIVQDATGEEHGKIAQVINDAFRDDLHAVITFGDGTNIGRFVRVSDLSQVQTEILD